MLKRILTALALMIYIVASIVAFGIMIALGILGLLEIVRGLSGKDSWTLVPEASPTIAENAIIHTLEGFEFLLLAPLAFVIIFSVGRYLTELLTQAADQRQAESQLHRVKALVASLMVSIIATDLVKRFVGKSDVNISAMTYGSGVILVLIIYILILNRPHRS